jgi:hypothetical protein
MIDVSIAGVNLLGHAGKPEASSETMRTKPEPIRCAMPRGARSQRSLTFDTAFDGLPGISRRA